MIYTYVLFYSRNEDRHEKAFEEKINVFSEY